MMLPENVIEAIRKSVDARLQDGGCIFCGFSGSHDGGCPNAAFVEFMSTLDAPKGGTVRIQIAVTVEGTSGERIHAMAVPGWVMEDCWNTIAESAEDMHTLNCVVEADVPLPVVQTIEGTSAEA